MISSTSKKQENKTSWLKEPRGRHIAQFYSSNHELVSSLQLYVSEGLKKDETCILIASPSHLKLLHEYCRRAGIDLQAAAKSFTYIEIDAAIALNSFMRGLHPDYTEFMKTVGHVMSLAVGRGRPIRAFGEMVAILWQDGNEQAMLQLEEYWNKLAKGHLFSLYCAYPDARFSSTPEHLRIIEKIKQAHSITAGSFA